MSKEQGQRYVDMFEAWAATMTDEDFIQIIYSPMGILNRQEVKKLSGISDQAIKKNPRVKTALSKLEDELRGKGVLPPLSESAKAKQGKPKLYDKNSEQKSRDLMRVSDLEATNHDLRVKVQALEGKIKRLEAQLATNGETIEAVDECHAVFALCPSN